MRKLALLFACLLMLLCMPVLVAPAHAQSNHPILGLWFYQPPTDTVLIVSQNHAHTTVSDVTFGTQYTDAATQGCINQGYPPVYLVRYRQDPITGWVVYCYTSQMSYIVISGAQFGQGTIDAAVARAQQIVYGTAITT